MRPRTRLGHCLRHLRLSSLVIIALLSLGFAASVPPATSQGWVSLGGPYGTTVPALATTDAALFAIDPSAAYRWDPSDQRWRPVLQQPVGTLYSLAAGPSGLLYAGGRGLHYSTDGGATWSWDLVDSDAHGGGNPDILAVGVGPDGTVLLGGRAGGYRRTTGGWTLFESPTPTAFAFDADGTVWAGSPDGVYRSSDGGASWTPDGLEGEPVMALARGPGGTLLAATESGVFRRSDNGVWEGPVLPVSVGALAAGASGVFWAGGPDALYGTADGGDTWTEHPAPLGPVHALSVDGGTVWAALGDEGLFRLEEGAWTRAATGLAEDLRLSDGLAVDGSLWVSSRDYGVFVRTGSTWERRNEGLRDLRVEEVLLRGDDVVARTLSGLAITPGGGSSWEGLPLPPSAERPLDMAADDAGALYVLSASDPVGGDKRLHAIADGETTWTLLLEEEADFHPHQVAADGAGVLLVVGTDATQVGPAFAISHDGGATWQRGGTAGLPNFPTFHDVDIAPGGAFYLTTSGAVYRSSGGQAWEELPPPPVSDSPFVPVEGVTFIGERLYGYGRGVARSSDGGLTWEPIGSGLPPWDGGAPSVSFVAEGPTGGVVAGTPSGVFAMGVDDAPVAASDTYETGEDEVLEVSAPGVLSNDGGVKEEALTAELVEGPEAAALDLNADGSFTLTPSPDFNGIITFTYRAVGANASSAPATVTVEVVPVNDAPTASAVTDPEDGAEVVVAGDPGSLVTVAWTASEDVDGDAVSYEWQATLTEGTFGDLLLAVATETTSLEVAIGDLAAALDEAGVGVGEAAVLYHRVVSTDGEAPTAGPVATVTLQRGVLTGAEGDAPPTEFAAGGAYPNPTAGPARIAVDLPWPAEVTVEVYDTAGREVAVRKETLGAGRDQTFSLDDLALSTGVYLYRLVAASPSGAEVATGRLTVVR